jgi:CheY-like chemotaxis protein/HPt (histidine-containing phosphotransfer) domain-containing protein
MSDYSRRGNATRRILIVGDPALSRSLMKMVLGGLDYVVTCAASAAEAATALRRTRFALIMVALHLPDSPGVAYARRLREREATATPILVFGDAWDQEAVLHECRAAGLDGYLPKPISIARLVATVRELTRQAFAHPDGGAAMPDEASPIDLAHFESFTDGDEQLERELITIYLSTAVSYLAEMREALVAGAPWDRPAHSLKGASANLGAVEVAALAKAAEHAAPDPEYLKRLGEALGEVRRFFERRIGRDLAEPVPA